MVSHPLLTPDLGTANKERMQVQAEKLKIAHAQGLSDKGVTFLEISSNRDLILLSAPVEDHRGRVMDTP